MKYCANASGSKEAGAFFLPFQFAKIGLALANPRERSALFPGDFIIRDGVARGEVPWPDRFAILGSERVYDEPGIRFEGR